jgi:predicted DNA binding CopG/RHH family protein
MKKKLTPATLPLPKFKSDREAAEYFESHSLAEIWDQLPAVRASRPSPALAKSIRDRHEQAKTAISIRLAKAQIDAAKRIAEAKSVAYQTQLRMWIAEGIRRDSKRAQA